MSIIPETAAERRRRLLEQRGSTYMAHTRDDLDVGGRYLQDKGCAQVISQSGAPEYPAGAEWVMTELPPEPSLGFDNPALDNPALDAPVSASPERRAPSGPPANEQSEADLAVSFDRGDAGPSSSSSTVGDDPAPPGVYRSPTRHGCRTSTAGSPPSTKRS
jgi:hypothetical protein